MSARKRITKVRFYAINRDAKVPGSRVKAIAAVHNVSEETVRTIKRAKTWPRFEAMKKLKNERRRPTTPGAPLKAVVPVQQPLTDVEQLDKITQAPENQIRPKESGEYWINPQHEVKVLTVLEWEAINRKIDRLFSHVTKKQRKPLLGLFRRAK